MVWKEMSVEELAEKLDVSLNEVREKQRLIELIVKARKESGVSQAALAKKVEVTQGRIAQIESGIGTSRITFDILLNLLSALGYQYKIQSKRGAA